MENTGMPGRTVLDEVTKAVYAADVDRIVRTRPPEERTFEESALVAMFGHIQVIEKRARTLGTINHRVDALMSEVSADIMKAADKRKRALERGESIDVDEELAVNAVKVDLVNRYTATVAMAVHEAR